MDSGPSSWYGADLSGMCNCSSNTTVPFRCLISSKEISILNAIQFFKETKRHIFPHLQSLVLEVPSHFLLDVIFLRISPKIWITCTCTWTVLHMVVNGRCFEYKWPVGIDAWGWRLEALCTSSIVDWTLSTRINLESASLKKRIHRRQIRMVLIFCPVKHLWKHE